MGCWIRSAGAVTGSRNTEPLGPVGDPEEWQRHHHPEAESFQEDQSGLLLPTPTGKQARFLMFEGGLGLQVAESHEEIRRRVGHLRETDAHWLELTDPQFGETLVISALAAARSSHTSPIQNSSATAAAEMGMVSPN